MYGITPKRPADALGRHKKPKLYQAPGEIFLQTQALTGPSVLEKMRMVTKEFESAGLCGYIETSVENIAWILNIRGKGFVPNCGTFRAIGIFDSCTMPGAPRRRRWWLTVFSDVFEIMRNDNESPLWDVFPSVELDRWAMLSETMELNINPYEQFWSYWYPVAFRELSRKAQYGYAADLVSDEFRKDRGLTSEQFAMLGNFHCLPSIITYFRNRKTKYEIECFRSCGRQEGGAWLRFLMTLEELIEDGVKVTEKSATELLDSFRVETRGFVQNALDTKVLVNALDFDAKPSDTKVLKEGDIVTVRSGGHYKIGTTGVTQSFFIGRGEPSDEQRVAYTAVLKSLINVHMVQYPPEHAPGANVLLDRVARHPLRANGMDYAHDTAHGVCNGLTYKEEQMGIWSDTRGVNIPENLPQKMHKYYAQCHSSTLTPHVVLAVQPSYIKPGAYGIRLENVSRVMVSTYQKYDKPKDAFEERKITFENLLRRLDGRKEIKQEPRDIFVSITPIPIEDPKLQTHEVNPVTLVPFFRKLMKTSMLTEAEKLWLNNYHDRCGVVSHYDSPEKAWLREAGLHIE